MSVERRRYIGPYGRKHRTAFVPGVGNLYLNELVEVDREAGEVRHVFSGKKLNDLTAEALATLYGDEFASADTDCTYTLASGAICEKPRVAGTVYCELHGLLAAAPESTVKVSAEHAGFRLETPDVLHGDGFSELHDDPSSWAVDEKSDPAADVQREIDRARAEMGRRILNLTLRHICRLCHADFESSGETDDVCPKCLARTIDDDVPSPSDSPPPPPPPRDAEPQSIRFGTGRSTLRNKPPDATIASQ